MNPNNRGFSCRRSNGRFGVTAAFRGSGVSLVRLTGYCQRVARTLKALSVIQEVLRRNGGRRVVLGRSCHFGGNGPRKPVAVRFSFLVQCCKNRCTGSDSNPELSQLLWLFGSVVMCTARTDCDCEQAPDCRLSVVLSASCLLSSQEAFWGLVRLWPRGTQYHVSLLPLVLTSGNLWPSLLHHPTFFVGRGLDIWLVDAMASLNDTNRDACYRPSFASLSEPQHDRRGLVTQYRGFHEREEHYPMQVVVKEQKRSTCLDQILTCRFMFDPRRSPDAQLRSREAISMDNSQSFPGTTPILANPSSSSARYDFARPMGRVGEGAVDFHSMIRLRAKNERLAAISSTSRVCYDSCVKQICSTWCLRLIFAQLTLLRAVSWLEERSTSPASTHPPRPLG